MLTKIPAKEENSNWFYSRKWLISRINRFFLYTGNSPGEQSSLGYNCQPYRFYSASFFSVSPAMRYTVQSDIASAPSDR